MTSYSPIVTLNGRAADQASKVSGGAAVRFTNLLLGDGAGSVVAPNETWTALTHQIASIPVQSVVRDIVDPTIVWVTAVYQDPASPAAPLPRGFVIRELAITLADGSFYAVGAVPETEIPLASQGAAREPTFRIPFIETASGGVVTLFSNPGQYATQTYVTNALAGLTIPTVPAFATLSQHLAGVATALMTNPAGVAAMLAGLRTTIEGEFPAVPAFATLSQHLAGVATNLMTNPAGVAAMIGAASPNLLEQKTATVTNTTTASVDFSVGAYVAFWIYASGLGPSSGAGAYNFVPTYGGTVTNPSYEALVGSNGASMSFGIGVDRVGLNTWIARTPLVEQDSVSGVYDYCSPTTGDVVHGTSSGVGYGYRQDAVMFKADTISLRAYVSGNLPVGARVDIFGIKRGF